MRRHDLDPISLVFGLLFGGLGVVVLTGRLGALSVLRWTWPLVLLAVGAAVAVGARNDRSSPEDDDTP